MIRRVAVPLLLFLGTVGCVRRDGRNSDCTRPGEPGAKMLRPDQFGYEWHLAADGDFAEELADLYAGNPARLRSGTTESHPDARNRCIGEMFVAIGKTHGVEPMEVFHHFTENRPLLDLAYAVPFVLLCGVVASRMAPRVWNRYRADSRVIAIALLALCSLAFGFFGVKLGGLWSGLAENIRVGDGDLGIRASRLLWGKYRMPLFAFLLILFWAVAAISM